MFYKLLLNNAFITLPVMFFVLYSCPTSFCTSREVKFFNQTSVSGFSGENQNSTGAVSRILKMDHLSLSLNLPGWNVPVPDPYLTVEHDFEYWPYKRIYHFQFSRIYNIVSKLLWNLWEIATLGLKILFQVLDIFHMKKSFHELSINHGPGWGWEED